MPRYYCDYCDTYLTHDSPSVRKQHNAGYKHKANVRIYYQQFEEQQTQSLIDQRIKEHLGQAAAYNQVGGAFNQHMLARPRLPMMPMPMGMRPPLLPRPMMPGQGYMPPPGLPQMMAPPGAPLPPPPQNGMLRPPGMASLPGQGGGPPPNYNGLPLPPPPPYQTNPAAAAPPSGGGFNNPNPGAESPESNE
ncbi:hypothetical protein Bca4012_003313 [Brassica carinata]|uniref:U1 small nuclear ribonucleoprotein C n=1 Tax=Brassica carinata TaxID=52824 RepID=A0A8X7S4R7_BRACI|nr:hypothetical protein Bca52824_044173 [Brassica carinata]